MKQPPDIKRLTEYLADCGFMGSDSRQLEEIISCDLAKLDKLGLTASAAAARMAEITEKAAGGLGEWVVIGNDLEAKIDDAKGRISCPYPHIGSFYKRITTVRQRQSGKEIFWSDLNIHLIGEHNFFEGIGSPFRLEPEKLAEMIL